MRADVVEPEGRRCEAVFGVVLAHFVEDGCAEGGGRLGVQDVE